MWLINKGLHLVYTEPFSVYLINVFKVFIKPNQILLPESAANICILTTDNIHISQLLFRMHSPGHIVMLV